jgi:hypothetical protein
MTGFLRWATPFFTVWIGASSAFAGPPAAPAPSFYISTFGGLSAPIDPQFEDPAQSGELGTELGFAGGISLGTRLSVQVRAEIELAIHENNVVHVKIDGAGTFPLTGDITVFTSMLKLAYDFELGSWKPYLAAGVGMANYQISLDAPASGSDQKAVLAGEIEGGMTIPLTDRLDLFTSTRLLVLSSLYLDPTGTGGAELQNPLLLSSSIGLRIGF